MTPTNESISQAIKEVLIEHVEAAEGDVLKLVHFAGKKFHIAEEHVVALIKREAHDVLAAGDAIVEFGEEEFHIAEDAVIALLRLHGKPEAEEADASTDNAAEIQSAYDRGFQQATSAAEVAAQKAAQEAAADKQAIVDQAKVDVDQADKAGYARGIADAKAAAAQTADASRPDATTPTA